MVEKQIQSSEKQNSLEIKMVSDIANVILVRHKITNFLEKQDGIAIDGIIYKISLVIEETLANIIEHGYKFSKDNKIEINVQFSSNRLTMVFMDYAPEYSLDNLGNVDLKNQLNERKRGGWGWYIIQKEMDSIELERVDSKMNRLTMIKKY